MNKNLKLAVKAFGLTGCMLLCANGLSSCVGGAKTSIKIPSAKYRVSMSPLIIAPGEPSDEPAQLNKVGKFNRPYSSWAMVYGLASFAPEVDLSNAINDEIQKAGGDAMTNFRVEAYPCSINAAPILSILPFWPSCVMGRATGDIIRMERSSSPKTNS